MPKIRPLTISPGLPLCVAPCGNDDVCKQPAIAKITGRFPARHVCHDHLAYAISFYKHEPLDRKEDVEYLTARARKP